MARMNSGRTQERQERTDSNTDRTPERGGKAYKEIFGVVDRGEQSFWTRIGVAFPNNDVMRSPALCGARELVGVGATAGARIYSA